MRKQVILALFATVAALVVPSPAHADAQSCMTSTLKTVSGLRADAANLDEPDASQMLASIEHGLRTLTIHSIQEGAAIIVKGARRVIAADAKNQIDFSRSTVKSARSTVHECSPLV